LRRKLVIIRDYLQESVVANITIRVRLTDALLRTGRYAGATA
jgi:hypothetical protein